MLPSESLGSYLMGAEASRPSLLADLDYTYARKRTQTPARADTHAHCNARTHKRTSHMRAFAQARSRKRTHAHAFASNAKHTNTGACCSGAIPAASGDPPTPARRDYASWWVAGAAELGQFGELFPPCCDGLQSGCSP
jgi:hypothetical protein